MPLVRPGHHTPPSPVTGRRTGTGDGGESTGTGGTGDGEGTDRRGEQREKSVENRGEKTSNGHEGLPNVEEHLTRALIPGSLGTTPAEKTRIESVDNLPTPPRTAMTPLF
ncbi:hypothetical protein B005_5603 [Nocardiopsis alba ATCC BAA-2165]|uniref:Uncharacterized protein n=1 Tax=Nocardiopsis alba (strain ATCC BAA-2165 / BE74) TaxID=1205910 RepID=J7L7A4_NOCAA|nr:hypothetical protein B005_5603 [Nocardiopsis alba ATCC BAA-2165]